MSGIRSVTDLAALAAEEDLQPLWKAIHERLCSGETPDAVKTVTVPGLTAEGIATLRGWLDTTARRRRGTSSVSATPGGIRVPVRDLCQALHLSGEQLVAVAEAAVGAAVDDRSAASRLKRRTRAQWRTLTRERLPHLPGLAARVAETPDVTQARGQLDALAAAFTRLPASRPVSLPKLAHDATGDPHYFDLDTVAGRWLVAGVAELLGEPEPARPDHVKALLLRAGVVADRLSATVLLLNVQVDGAGPIDERLRSVDVPVALTLLDLTVHPPRLRPGQVLTVVENPSVLEEAMARSYRGALACTNGQLGAVDHVLLTLARQAAVQVRYAGDSDLTGQLIARSVAHMYGAHPIGMIPDAAQIVAVAPAEFVTDTSANGVLADAIGRTCPDLSGVSYTEEACGEHIGPIPRSPFQEDDAHLDSILG
jgi:uncharacterized protein (TIGR02679 family)